MNKNWGVELGAQCLAIFSTSGGFSFIILMKWIAKMTGQGDEIGFHRQDNCHLFTGQATISLLFLHIQFAIKIETIA